MIPLLDVTIKVSAIVLVALAATRMSRARSAATRHCVLASAIACAAIVPLLGLAAPSWRIDWLPASPTGRTTVAVAPVSPASIDTTVDAPIAVTVSDPAAGARIQDMVVPVWLAGAAFSLLILLAGLARLAWIASRASAVERGRWPEITAQIAREYGLSGSPRLLQSDHPALLVTWGLLHPKVLLPAGAAAWTDERIRVVIAHELAHVRRRDWLVQIGSDILRSIYWFNPLLWIGCSRLRQEGEQACDDAVLRLGIGGTSYAAHLLDLARAFRAYRRVWLPAAAIARPSRLERRVTAMLSAQTDRRPVTPRIAAAILVAFLGVTAAVAGFDVFAQSRFATVSGTVVDQSGGVLVNATLVLSNVQTNAKNEVRTNQTGFYEFVGLPAGDFELEVRQPAFRPVKEPLSLGVGETLQRNVTLQIGAVQETITITAHSGSDHAPSPHPRPHTTRLPARPRCPSPEIGGCVGPPVKVKDVRPIYPASLSEAGVQGVVLLEANITSEGKTNVVRVIAAPHPGLERAAIEAVSQWEFAPTALNGSPIDTPMNISVTFRLPEAAAQP